MKTFLAFNSALERWFEKTARDFPWRKTSDPYKIWVSEIMSRQTQVECVAENFYPRFLEKFPNVKALAKAEWEDIYPIWKGLGFYDRGKEMNSTAKIIMEKFNGKFPQDFATLKTLPGIGRHTAAAILSYSKDLKIAVIDANVSKILRNIWPEKPVFDSAKTLINSFNSGKMWNLAMVDLISFLRSGQAIEGDLGQFFPKGIAIKFLSIPKKNLSQNKKRIVEVGVACIYKNGKYLIQSRPPGKSFPGAWEFPGGKRNPGERFRDCVRREIQEELGVDVSVRPHFHEIVCNFQSTQLRLRFHQAKIKDGDPRPLENQVLKWATTEEFDDINFLKTNAGALIALKKIEENKKQ